MRGRPFPPRANARSHPASPSQAGSSSSSATCCARNEAHQCLEDVAAVLRVGEVESVQLTQQARQDESLRRVVGGRSELGIER